MHQSAQNFCLELVIIVALAFAPEAMAKKAPQPTISDFTVTSVIISNNTCYLRVSDEAGITYSATGWPSECAGTITGDKKRGYVEHTNEFDSVDTRLYFIKGFDNKKGKYKFYWFTVDSESR